MSENTTTVAAVIDQMSSQLRPDTNKVARYFTLALVILLPLRLATIAINPGQPAWYGEWYLWLVTAWPVTILGGLVAAAWALRKKPWTVSLKGAVFLLPALLVMVHHPVFFAAESKLGAVQELAVYLSAVGAFAFLLDNFQTERPGFRNAFFYAVTISLILVILQGLYQWFFEYEQMTRVATAAGLPEQMQLKIAEKRIFAQFSMCNALAGFLLLSMPLAIWSMADWYNKNKIKLKAKNKKIILFIYFLLAVGFIFVLYHTGSRSAVAALGAGALVAILAGNLKNKIKIIILAGLGIILTGILIYFICGTERSGSSLGARLAYYQVALQAMIEYPVSGIGFGNFAAYYHTNLPPWAMAQEIPQDAHNILLSFGAQMGILAFLLMGVLLIAPIVLLWRQVRQNHGEIRSMEGAALVALSMAAVHMLLDVDWEFAPILALYWGLAAIMVKYPAILANWRPQRQAVASGVLVIILLLVFLPSARLTYYNYKYAQNLQCLQGARIAPQKPDNGSPYADRIYFQNALALMSCQRNDLAKLNLAQAIKLNPRNRLYADLLKELDKTN